MSNLKVGIVGLPNVGKSTLFNALLKKRVANVANYPFCTIDPNVGVVAVPDERLNELAELIKVEEKMQTLPPIIPAVVEFVDIAGLVKGASKGAGLGNQFLSHIREVDAIVHVVRDFGDVGVIREGSENPDSDKLVIETELGLSDLQVLEKLIAGQETLLRQGSAGHEVEKKKLDILYSVQKNLEAGKIIGRYEMGSFDSAQDLRDERLQDWFSTLPLLTTKPILYVFNVSEEEYGQKLLGREYNGNELVISAKLEEELADYSEEDRKAYLKELGIEQTGLERLIIKAYGLLGLISYLTAGVKEIRAWTIKQGTKAPQAAGVIHTDFEKKFIRAQVISYEKLIEAGSYAQAKAKGWIKTEGKDYIVQDGDVVEFLIGS